MTEVPVEVVVVPAVSSVSVLVLTSSVVSVSGTCPIVVADDVTASVLVVLIVVGSG